MRPEHTTPFADVPAGPVLKAINYIAATLGIPEPHRLGPNGLGPNGLAAVLRWRTA